MTDPVSRGIADLDRVPVPLAWDEVLDRIDRGPTLGTAVIGDPKPAGRRRWLIAAAALVILGLGVVVLVKHEAQVKRIYHGITGTQRSRTDSVPGSEGYTSPYRAAHLQDWLDGDDQAEIEYLRRTGEYQPTLLDMVVTMEFRIACRETERARVAAVAADPGDRASVVDGIMAPEIARLADRTEPPDQTVAMFTDLANKLKAGDPGYVADWLSGQHGSCVDALAYGH